jgi:heme-degrading monooxygenase HmoA
MIAVIFEVWPKAGHKQQYLDLAAALRPQLERIDGFISVERFETKRRWRRGGTSRRIALPRRKDARRCSRTIDCGSPG